jgi:hypothetical protein
LILANIRRRQQRYGKIKKTMAAGDIGSKVQEKRKKRVKKNDNGEEPASKKRKNEVYIEAKVNEEAEVAATEDSDIEEGI